MLPRFGQTWTRIGHHGPHVFQFWSMAKFEYLLTNVDRTWSNVGRSLVNLGQRRPTNGPTRPNCAELSQLLANNCPMLAKLLPNFGQLIFVEFWSKLGQRRPNFGPHWVTLVEDYRLRAEFAQTRTNFGPNRPTLVEAASNLGSRGSSSATFGPAAVAKTQFCCRGLCLNRRDSGGAHLSQCNNFGGLTLRGASPVYMLSLCATT